MRIVRYIGIQGTLGSHAHCGLAGSLVTGGELGQTLPDRSFVYHKVRCWNAHQPLPGCGRVGRGWFGSHHHGVSLAAR